MKTWARWLTLPGLALALLAVGTSLGLTARSTPAEAAGPAPALTRQAGSEVLVYFSKLPEADADFSAVFPVNRWAPDAGVARSALQHLIAGPTEDEIAAGYFSELGAMLVGPSDCGADFSIRIDDGTATVRFCRLVTSAGIGQDARVHSALTATLLQFPTIQRVRLLTPEGECLFDMSGENRCLTR